MELCVHHQGQYFLVRDVCADDDKLGTLKHFSAPNVSEALHGFPVYGLGQPTMNGIADLVQELKDRGKQVLSAFRHSPPWITIIMSHATLYDNSH